MAALRSRPQPLAYSIKDAAEATGVSVTTLERFIASGDITVRYANAKRVLPAAELTAWLESLPIEREKAVTK